MASITARGFCAEAALSRNTSGLPCTVCARIGKSARMRCDVESRRVESRSCRVLHPTSLDRRFQQRARAVVGDRVAAPRRGRRAPGWRAPSSGGCRGCADRTAGRRRARRPSRRGCTSRRRRRSRAAACSRSRRRATAAAPGSSGSRRSSAPPARPRSGPGTRRGRGRSARSCTVWRERAGGRVVRDHGGDVAVLLCRPASCAPFRCTARAARAAARGSRCARAARRRRARSLVARILGEFEMERGEVERVGHPPPAAGYASAWRRRRPGSR